MKHFKLLENVAFAGAGLGCLYNSGLLFFKHDQSRKMHEEQEQLYRSQGMEKKLVGYRLAPTSNMSIGSVAQYQWEPANQVKKSPSR